MKKFLIKNYYFLIAISIFLVVVTTEIKFYKVVILLLEFIVILEVVKMVADFIENQKVRLRFIIDMFIIFFCFLLYLYFLFLGLWLYTLVQRRLQSELEKHLKRYTFLNQLH